MTVIPWISICRVSRQKAQFSDLNNNAYAMVSFHLQTPFTFRLETILRSFPE